MDVSREECLLSCLGCLAHLRSEAWFSFTQMLYVQDWFSRKSPLLAPCQKTTHHPKLKTKGYGRIFWEMSHNHHNHQE